MAFVFGHLLVGETIVLPLGVVAILNAQRSKALASGCLLSVEREQFLHDEIEGPAVADDMVHVEDQDVIIGAHAKQRDPEERCLLKIEGAVRLGDGACQRFLPGIGHVTKVFFDKEPFDGLLDNLTWLTIKLGEAGSQRLMSLYQLSQGESQVVDVESATQSRDGGDVVRGVVNIHVVDDPEPALRMRQRIVRAVRYCVDGHRGLRFTPLNDRGQLAHRRPLEDFTDVNLDLHLGENAADEQDRLHAVAAQIEERFVCTDLVNAEDLLPDRAESDLDRPRRRGIL